MENPGIIEQFLRFYLDSLHMEGVGISITQDGPNTMYVVEIPHKNGKKIGIFKGRGGRNLLILKQFVQILGPLYREKPYLLIKLID